MERVLVIDDCRDSREIMTVILERAGYKPLQAEDGNIALSKLEQMKPDLVLLDINMPGMNGFEVCKLLKARTAVPIIFITAQSDSSDKLRGLELGASDYIVKPYDKGEVIARIRNQLKLQSLLHELSKANEELEDKSKRLDEDLRAAAEVQKSLLPPSNLVLKNVDLAWRFLPSFHIAGDVFQVVPLTENRVAFYMIDVSGHGVAAALVAAAVVQSLQSTFLTGSYVSPNKVMEFLDKEFPMERFDRYLTAVFCVLDTDTSTLTYSNAGHPAPYIIKNNGKVELLNEGGTILGLGRHEKFEEGKKKLSAGDKIILFTDGVTECPDKQGELFGDARLRDLLIAHKSKSVGELVESVIKELASFSGDAPVHDDVSLLALNYRGGHAV